MNHSLSIFNINKIGINKMPKIEKVPTGIPGLDKLIEGGLIKGSVNLLSGGTGTGKTIFCSQLLWNILQRGYNAIYICLEQDSESILKYSELMGFNFRPFIDKNKCVFIDIFPSSFDELEKLTFDKVVEIDAKILAVDSLSALLMSIKEDPNLRRRLFNFVRRLMTLGVTTLLTTEIPSTDTDTLSRFGFEEFLADGIIVLYNKKSKNLRVRGLEVLKLRGTNHSNKTVPFTISKSGISVHEKMELFGESK